MDRQIVAFVAGATGYVGQAVVARLAAQGIRTVAHVRPDSPSLDRWRQRFEALGATVDATPWTPADMAATLADLRPTLVFCLVGTTRSRMQGLKRSGGDPAAASYESVDYGLTALLAAAAAACGSRPRFAYLSSLGAGAGARGAYMRWRTRAEEAVQASGLPFTLVRPAIITGPDREENRTGESVANTVVDGGLKALKALGVTEPWRRYRSIDATALAAAMVRLALDPAATNRIVERGDL